MVSIAEPHVWCNLPMALLADVAKLADEWHETAPAEAEGGWFAVAGFRHQFLVTLDETITAWKALSKGQRQRPAVLAELLSDAVTAVPNKPAIVVQVKRGASGEAVRAGLTSLFALHEFARARRATSAKTLRFRLVLGRGRVASSAAIATRWAAGDPQREEFVSRLELIHDVDPHARLLESLISDFDADEPVRLIDTWVGKLMRSVSYAADSRSALPLREVAEDIWSELLRLERKLDRGGTPLNTWREAWQPPSRPSRGRVLTGEQPHPDELVDGAFAPRPHLVEPLAARFEAHASTALKARTHAVPIFWIGGRSGSGKSVALLFLLARLSADGWGPIVWLGNRAGRLPDALRWARRAWDGEGQVIIGLDDPFLPAGVGAGVFERVLDQVDSMRGVDGRDPLPLLVCAGPSEQVELLERTYPGSFDIFHARVEAAPKDLEMLRAWYEGRTGFPAPPEASRDALLVQLIFEWSKGERIDQFALRFRERIRLADTSGGVLSFITRVLALNRIYIGYPAAAATAELNDLENDVLQRLLADDHFAIGREDDRPGIWLTHPHLAAAIYDAWHPRDGDANQRAGHWRDAARACLELGANSSAQIAPLRVAGLAFTDEPVTGADRVDPQILSEIPVLYAEARRQYRGMAPLTHLATWIRLRVAGADLDPDPVVDALQLLTPQATRTPGCGWTTMALLRAYDRLSETERGDLITLVIRMLKEAPRWSDWPIVASTAIELAPNPDLRDLIGEWLGKYLDRERAGWPLISALNQFPGSGQLHARAGELLAVSSHPDWGRVWTTVWDLAPSHALAEQGIGWLRSHMTKPGWAYVWGRLWLGSAASKPTLVELGLEFLAEQRDHGGWARTWTTLWEHRSEEVVSAHVETLIGEAERWLSQADQTAAPFSFVWCALWGARPRAPLTALGVRALARLPYDSPSWGQMLPLLLRGTAARKDALRLGHDWLERAPADAPAWGYVLPAMARNRMAPDPDRVVAADAIDAHGERFIRDASANHPGWSHVFASMDASGKDMRRVGIQWLSAVHEDHPGWGHVWQRLWERRTDESYIQTDTETALTSLARSWLDRVDKAHTGWPWVWSRLAAHALDPVVRDLGKAWLALAPLTETGWTFVFRPLWADKPTDDLRELAVEWLRQVTDNEHWDLIWQLIWPDSSGTLRLELQERGTAWLHIGDSAGWPRVWRALYDDRPTAELELLGQQWLRGPGFSSPNRHLIAKALGEPEPRELPTSEPSREWMMQANELRSRFESQPREDLLREALDVLAMAPEDASGQAHIAWKNLWLELWRFSRREEMSALVASLREIGVVWLERTTARAAGRSYVWEALWTDAPTRRLFTAGLSYLRTSGGTSAKWPDIWRSLYTSSLADDEGSSELERLALEWLAESYPRTLLRETAKWPRVWLALWGVRRSTRLEELGMQAVREVGTRAPLEEVWLALWDVASLNRRRELHDIGREIVATRPSSRLAGAVAAVVGMAASAHRDAK